MTVLRSRKWTGDKKLTVGLRQKGYSRVVSTADLWDILEMTG